MGQAKQRGTREARIKQAKESNQNKNVDFYLNFYKSLPAFYTENVLHYLRYINEIPETGRYFNSDNDYLDAKKKWTKDTHRTVIAISANFKNYYKEEFRVSEVDFYKSLAIGANDFIKEQEEKDFQDQLIQILEDTVKEHEQKNLIKP